MDFTPQVVQTEKSLSSIRFIGTIPALNDHRLRWQGGVGLEPLPFHKSATQWRRRLLVLTGKIVFADLNPQLFKELQGLTFRMKRFSDLAPKGLRKRFVDAVELILLGDCRELGDRIHKVELS